MAETFAYVTSHHNPTPYARDVFNVLVEAAEGGVVTVPRVIPICESCALKRLKDSDDPFELAIACDAFPEDIPDEIYFNGFDHREPFPGDGGIRYVPTRSRPSCSPTGREERRRGRAPACER